MDRSTEAPETLSRLRAVAGEYASRPPPWGEAPTVNLDGAEVQRLRALGYAVAHEDQRRK